MTEREIRNKVVAMAEAYAGCKESDGSHRKIIDGYNAHKPLARGYKVTYTDAWCATFVSFVAIKCGLTDIMFTECGCGAMINLYKAAGRWHEGDAYIPEAGDVIMYDWDDNGAGECTGYPEHVGIVVSVSGNTVKVIEGNISNKVGYRTIAVNGRYIRGYCLPDFESKATEAESSKPSGNTSSNTSGTLNRTPKWTGVVTATELNVRKWAGKEYDNIKSYPVLGKGNEIDVCDSVKASNGDKWYYIRIAGKYYGFVHSDYIKKASVAEAKKELAVGDVVNFTGSKHYTSSYKTAKAKACKAGQAKITAINAKGAHPYHLVRTSGSKATVHGWVNKDDIEA